MVSTCLLVLRCTRRRGKSRVLGARDSQVMLRLGLEVITGLELQRPRMGDRLSVRSGISRRVRFQVEMDSPGELDSFQHEEKKGCKGIGEN